MGEATKGRASRVKCRKTQLELKGMGRGRGGGGWSVKILLEPPCVMV